MKKRLSRYRNLKALIPPSHYNCNIHKHICKIEIQTQINFEKKILNELLEKGFMIPLKFKNVKHLLVTVFSITNSRFKSFDSYKNGLQMSVIYRLHKKRLQIIATFSWFRYFSSPKNHPQNQFIYGSRFCCVLLPRYIFINLSSPYPDLKKIPQAATSLPEILMMEVTIYDRL